MGIQKWIFKACTECAKAANMCIFEWMKSTHNVTSRNISIHERGIMNLITEIKKGEKLSLETFPETLKFDFFKFEDACFNFRFSVQSAAILVNLKNIRAPDEVCNSLSEYFVSEPNSRIPPSMFKSNVEFKLTAYGMEGTQLNDIMKKVDNCINNENDAVVKVL